MDKQVEQVRSGAVTSAAKAQAPGIERLLRRRATPLPADLFVRVCDWVAKERRRLNFTQRAFAQHYKIPLRQVKTYEAVALRWPREAKSLVAAAPDKFRVGDLTRLFANRQWKSKESLLNALRRHADGKAPRKAYKTSEGAKDPNILALEDRLRDKLQTRVEVTGDGSSGELRISFFSLDQLECLLERIDSIP